MNNFDFIFDSSFKNISLVLKNQEAVFYSQKILESQTQSQSLLPAIIDLLDEAGISQNNLSKKINKVIFCNGPGSFTSLRVGFSTLQGLFLKTNVPLFCVSSLRARVFSVRENTQKTVAAALPLGRERFAVGVLKSDQTKNEFFQQIVFAQDLVIFLKQYNIEVFSGVGICGRDGHLLDGFLQKIIDSDFITSEGMQKSILDDDSLCLKNWNGDDAIINYMIEPDIG